MNYIMMVLGWILQFFYRLVGNYGVSIILFTIFIKLLLLPLDLKQKKSMAKTQKLQPLLNAVQQKYANDKEKLSQETMKLYQKYGINPMGGCLPMLIQLPIIFSLFYVIKQPLMYMMGVDFGETWRVANAYNEWLASLGGAGEVFESLPESIRTAVVASSDGKLNTFGINEIKIARVISEHPEILKSAHLTPELAGKLSNINFDFLGMDLSQTPDYKKIFAMFGGVMPTLGDALLWLIPVFSGASAWFSAHISRPQQPKEEKHKVLAENEKPKENASADTMKSMTMMMPFMSVFFAFTLPAGVGLYWIVSNLIQIAQHFLVNKFFNVDVSLEEMEGDMQNVKSRKKRKNSR